MAHNTVVPSSSSLHEEDQLYVINTVRKAAGADALTQMVHKECLAEAGHYGVAE
jgi:hypothetical protein